MYSFALHKEASKKTQSCTYINTIVIGAGPTGLATSFLLKENQIEHIVLEKESHIVPNWTSLWKNYRLAMPAQKVTMPGVDVGALVGKKTHLTKGQAIAFFNEYATFFNLPIHCSQEVCEVTRLASGGFEVRTSLATYICDNVVCCLGPRQEPKLPATYAALAQDSVLKVLHSKNYYSPDGLKKNDHVLVVGSGLSALSICQDIVDNGFSVSLACGATHEEIVARNKHIYQDEVDTNIVPTLASLANKGVKNLGRLFKATINDLFFQQGAKAYCRLATEFTVVIFATGYELSYQLLNKMLKIPGQKIDAECKRISAIPGLYIAGIPEPSQQTVLLSQGSEHAAEIVKDILASQRWKFQKSSL